MRETDLRVALRPRRNRYKAKAGGYLSWQACDYCLLSDCSASRACCTSFRRSSFSSAGASLASPVTWTIPVPKTTRLDPTILAIGRAEVICTTGMPALSSSVVIAAPLRVLVPHVEVRMTASTPSCLIFSTISLPSRRVFDSGLERPQVERNSS